MYTYDFEGRRYDVGDKLGFLQATVEYALRKEKLIDGFIEYLKTIIWIYFIYPLRIIFLRGILIIKLIY